MIEQLIAEATECDFKAALETKKPKSWLKSVSAFANGIGGMLVFGVEDNRQICEPADYFSFGLADKDGFLTNAGNFWPINTSFTTQECFAPVGMVLKKALFLTMR